MNYPRPARDWVVAFRRYLAATAVIDLAWESAQMPLYTLWQTATHGEIAFALFHCTAGDIVIAAAALLAALAVFGLPEWPHPHRWRVDIATIVFGIGYTVGSEHLNTARGAWAYSDLMPTLPRVGIGLAPMAQWLLVPALALTWAYRSGRCAAYRGTSTTRASPIPAPVQCSCATGAAGSSRDRSGCEFCRGTAESADQK